MWYITNTAIIPPKKPLSYGWTDMPNRVGQSGIFLILIFKNDPKNTKIEQKIWHFLLKNFGKIFWLISKNFQLKFLDFGQKTADFTKF